MIILREDSNNQTFSFIPRKEEYNTMTITDEQTNTTTTISIVSDSISTYYHTITANFDLKEGNFYVLKVLNNTEVVFYDKVFCTNQSLVSFSVNNNTYTSHSTSNDFIIYE
jgi:hypothetical protein